MGRNDVDVRDVFGIRDRICRLGHRLDEWTDDHGDVDGTAPRWVRWLGNLSVQMIRVDGCRWLGTAHQMRCTWVNAGEFWRLDPDDPLYQPRGPWDDMRLTEQERAGARRRAHTISLDELDPDERAFVEHAHAQANAIGATLYISLPANLTPVPNCEWCAGTGRLTGDVWTTYGDGHTCPCGTAETRP